MVNLEGYTLQEKAWIVAREIAKNQKNPLLIKLAKELKTPENVYRWVKNHIEYKREKEDILYEPEETLKMGHGDCEDLTLLIGSLAKIQGHPVRIRIVENGTRHIYPLVRINGKWVVLDATPHASIPYINGVPKGYKIVIDGLVSDEGLSGFDWGSSKKTAVEEANADNTAVKLGYHFGKSILTGAGVTIGTALAHLALKQVGLSGLDDVIRVEVENNYVPKPGDHLLFYFKPKWYIPDKLEAWLAKKAVKRKLPNCRILGAYFKKDNRVKHLIVEVFVTKQESLSGIVLTVAAIAAALLAGGLAAYFTLDKVEKIIEKPHVEWIMEILPIVALIYGVAKIVGRQR